MNGRSSADEFNVTVVNGHVWVWASSRKSDLVGELFKLRAVFSIGVRVDSVNGKSLCGLVEAGYDLVGWR